MKNKVILSFLLLALILVLPLALADNSTDYEQNAKDCISNRLDEKDCSSLSMKEQVFVLLGAGSCKSEVSANSNDGECWPKSSCDITTTAQAILALDQRGSSTSQAEEWLISQNKTPSDMDWYIQIESNEESTCKINYDNKEYSFVISEDKKLNQGAGNCLTLSEGSWWLKVSKNCYDEEFEISCDKSFFTSKLFKKTGSSTIHISDEIHSGSSEGQTYEKIESFCLSDGNSCDYEGTLWGAFVLSTLDYDISSYMPYLTSLADDYDELLPESFLYPLTGEFNSELLEKQKDGYWDESGDKFYDTALALNAIQYDSFSQKDDAITWLYEVQDSDGCWGGIQNTAFLLYALWPSSSSSGGGGITYQDCEGSGYYCMASIDCEGSLLSDYDCAIPFKCCDTDSSTGTCSEEGGKICLSGEECSGSTVSASDLISGETCCLGTCQEPTEISECEEMGYNCRYVCYDDEETASYSCESGYSCCMKAEESGSLWWIWLLLLIIALVVLGIVYRDKLEPTWEKIQESASNLVHKKSSGGTGVKPNSAPRPNLQRPPIQRQILPPSSRRAPPQKRPAPKSSNELDDVLKKLKDMGK